MRPPTRSSGRCGSKKFGRINLEAPVILPLRRKPACPDGAPDVPPCRALQFVENEAQKHETRLDHMFA